MKRVIPLALLVLGASLGGLIVSGGGVAGALTPGAWNTSAGPIWGCVFDVSGVCADSGAGYVVDGPATVTVPAMGSDAGVLVFGDAITGSDPADCTSYSGVVSANETGLPTFAGIGKFGTCTLTSGESEVLIQQVDYGPFDPGSGMPLAIDPGGADGAPGGYSPFASTPADGSALVTGGGGGGGFDPTTSATAIGDTVAGLGPVVVAVFLGVLGILVLWWVVCFVRRRVIERQR